MFYCIEKIKEINDFYEQHHLSTVSSLKELKKQIENIEKLSIFVINTSFAKMSLNAKTEAKKDVKETKKIKYTPYLCDMLNHNNIVLTKEQFECIGDIITMKYDDYLEAINSQNFNGFSNIMQIPMNTQLLKPKPIVYDLTFEKIEYPDLTEKIKGQSKGFMGRAFGYFFGSK